MRIVETIDGVPVARDMTADEIAEFAARAEQATAARRASAVVTKAVFCSALWRAGILSKPEAVQAAMGEWPATFAAFTAGLSESDATDAEIKWAAVTEIHYADPLLQGLALYHAQGDQAAATALLDQIFGIDG